MKLGDDGAQRLLLIPFAPGIGDMVLMEPLLRAVLQTMRSWRVTMVAKEYAAELLPAGDYEIVSPSYFVTEPSPALRPFHKLLPQRAVAWAAEPLISLDLGPFERVLNLFWAWESRTPFDRWWTPQWPPRQGVIHAVDLLAGYIEEELETEIPVGQRVPRITPTPEHAQWAAGSLAAGVRPGGPVAAIVPVASDALKWWRPAKWARLNDQLARAGWRTILVAQHGHPHAEEIFFGCDSTPWWPDLSLGELTALLARCDLTIGVDTGPLHIAAALGVPWVGLFGATNPDLIGPYDRSRGRPVIARFPKAPSCDQCWLSFKNREDRCLTLPATGCTTLISVTEVMEAVESVSTGTAFASER
ncbi:MAG TPA: glycosyltransferase family 9 protein [Chloroflexota bacterium]